MPWIVGADGVACKRERGRSPKEYESEKKTCTGDRSGALFSCRKGATPTNGDDMNNAERIAAEIKKNSMASVKGTITELEFSDRNFSLWEEAKAAGCKEQVSIILWMG